MDDYTKELVVKYITGQANGSEKVHVKSWIREDPENEEYYISLYEAWHAGLHASDALPDPDIAFKNFILRNEPVVVGRRSILWRRLAVAASMAVFFGFGFYFYYNRSQVSALNWTEVYVKKGDKRKILLADGSTVWLNSGSRFRYAKDFGQTSRTVYLDGEAYFDIKPGKKNVPFIVNTSGYVIRDIGTVFNVKSYAEEGSFETAVIEGKISVEGKLLPHSKEESKVYLDEKQVIKIKNAQAGDPDKPMTTGMGGSAREPLKVLEISLAQVKVYNGWRDDLMVFESASFGEIAQTLGRRYNVKIDFGSEDLKDYVYSGTFRDVKDISTILNVIKETTPIAYTVKGRNIAIRRTN